MPAAPLESVPGDADACPAHSGGTYKVIACGCSTRKHQGAPEKGGYESKTDAEVMQELNRESA